jgi:hypothetical protein
MNTSTYLIYVKENYKENSLTGDDRAVVGLLRSEIL